MCTCVCVCVCGPKTSLASNRISVFECWQSKQRLSPHCRRQPQCHAERSHVQHAAIEQHVTTNSTFLFVASHTLRLVLSLFVNAFSVLSTLLTSEAVYI